MTELEYVINVGKIEEYQMINDVRELSKIFSLAKSTVVQGGVVVLVRISGKGIAERFDTLSTEDDLDQYKTAVFKHLTL